MKTPYNILGVHRNASAETIRAAFRRIAKACHPDLNSGDRTAEQRLTQVIAAYRTLKRPPERAAWDEYLRHRHRERTRRFAVDGAAALVGVSIAWLAIWLWVSPSSTQETSAPPPASRVVAAMGSESVDQQAAYVDASAHQGDDGGRKSDGREAAANRRIPDSPPEPLQQSASIQQPAVGSAEPATLLAKEWEQVQESGDLRAIWAFTLRNPDAPESVLARSKIVSLIDSEEDVSLLHVLRLAATERVAEQAQQRLIDLGPLAVAREYSVAPGAPSSNSPLQASLDETIKLLIGAKRQDSVAPGALSANSPRHVSVR